MQDPTYESRQTMGGYSHMTNVPLEIESHGPCDWLRDEPCLRRDEKTRMKKKPL